MCEKHSFQFPKSAKLLSRSDYTRLQKEGKRRFGKFILLEKTSSKKTESRLGITVTKKYGKAHERNRFKRIVREAYRLSRHDLPEFQDIVVKPRPYAKHAKMQDIQQDLKELGSLPL